MSLVIVHGGVQVDPARTAEVSAAATAFQARCLTPAGCLEYQLSWLAGAPDRLRLLEVWESEETAAEHTTQPHVRDWTGFVAGAAVEPPAFTKLVVEATAL